MVFISSLQTEFANERQILFDYLTTDALLGRFFEPFIFEKLPAVNHSVSSVYIQEEDLKTIIWKKSNNDITQSTKNQPSKLITKKTTGEADCELIEVVRRVLLVLNGELKRIEIQNLLRFKSDNYFSTPNI